MATSLFEIVMVATITTAVSPLTVGQGRDVLASTARPALAVGEDTGPPADRASQTPAGVEDQPVGKGAAAMERAAQANKYLFVFFYKDQGEQTRTMRKAFDAAMAEMADRAESITVYAAEPREKQIVDRLEVGRAPMPLVLAVAPNGAITRSYLTELDEQQLAEAFVSPCTARSLKALQQRKLVFVCVQSASTKLNDAAMQGVRAFQVDARYGQATEIVTLDPSDAAEAKFLSQLQVDPQTEEAVTVLLAPPGRPVATFRGATDKKTLVATVQKSVSGCGTGCGPKGCGPSKK